jgi:hypothetical protein
MAKKFSLLMAAVAVLAFAIPAMASAGTVTSSAGVLAPVGTVITGTSSNTETTNTKFGTLKCANVTVKGKLTENSGGKVAAKTEGVGSTKECKVGTKELTITDPTLLSLSSTAAGSGTVGLTFEATVPAIGTCHFAGTAVPFTYTAGSDSIHVAGKLTATPAACGTGTGAEIHGDFTLEIGSTGVILD